MKAYDEHMLHCPKCGGLSILGPTFSCGSIHGGMLETIRVPESMLWTCGKCGFKEHTRCKDHAPTD